MNVIQGICSNILDTHILQKRTLPYICIQSVGSTLRLGYISFSPSWYHANMPFNFCTYIIDLLLLSFSLKHYQTIFLTFSHSMKECGVYFNKSKEHRNTDVLKYDNIANKPCTVHGSIEVRIFCGHLSLK